MILPSFPSNIVVKDLLSSHEQGTLSFMIEWKAQSGISSYNVYRSRVPYGTFDLVNQSSITNNFYIDNNVDNIWDTDVFYCVSSLNVFGEGELSEPQTKSNTIEYQDRIGGTWSDSSKFVNNPHNNTYSTGKKSVSYKSVNPLPSNVMRRYQFNKIIKDELWLLQETGEKVFLFKRKQNNFNTTEETQDYRRQYSRQDNVEYYDPIVINVRIIDIEQTKQFQKQGVITRKVPRSWTIFTPRLSNKDIIVNSKNERLEVVNITPYNWRGTYTHQDFDLIKLESTDEAYTHAQLNVSNRINELL